MGSETILVVEDDEMVRQFVQTVLAGAGYRILIAASGPDALSICQERGEEISVVFTDLVMPEMDGSDLAQKLTEINPRIRIVYTSGYSEGTDGGEIQLDPSVPFVQKPFRAADLLKKIREVLDTGAAGAVRKGGA